MVFKTSKVATSDLAFNCPCRKIKFFLIELYRSIIQIQIIQMFLMSFVKLTDGIFGEDGFGGWTRVSSSKLILSHHPELILAAFHQVLDSVLSGRVQWISGGSGPSLGRGLLLFQDVVGDGLSTIARAVPQHECVGAVHLSDCWHLRRLRDS